MIYYYEVYKSFCSAFFNPILQFVFLSLYTFAPARFLILSNFFRFLLLFLSLLSRILCLFQFGIILFSFFFVHSKFSILFFSSMRSRARSNDCFQKLSCSPFLFFILKVYGFFYMFKIINIDTNFIISIRVSWLLQYFSDGRFLNILSTLFYWFSIN